MIYIFTNNDRFSTLIIEFEKKSRALNINKYT